MVPKSDMVPIKSYVSVTGLAIQLLPGAILVVGLSMTKN